MPRKYAGLAGLGGPRTDFCPCNVITRGLTLRGCRIDSVGVGIEGVRSVRDRETLCKSRSSIPRTSGCPVAGRAAWRRW